MIAARIAKKYWATSKGCTRITLKPDLSGNLNTSEKLILSIASAYYTKGEEAIQFV